MVELSSEEHRLFCELLDKEAIRELNMRNSRAIDRLDEAALRDCYWPDAYDNASFFEGDADSYVKWVLPHLREKRTLSHHAVCHMLIEVEGDHAYGESYFISHSYGPGADGATGGSIVCGRYLDHYEKRDGQWRFKHRRRVYDWNMEAPYASPWEASPLREKMDRGVHGPDDPVFHMKRDLR